METNEILKSNKLIAEFMGLAYCEKYQYEGWYKNSEFNNRVCSNEGLIYHLSWDWIMPVIEKIDQIGAKVTIGRMFCDIRYIDPLDQSKKFDIRIVSGVKINAINGAVIEFIKWYNENK